MIMKTNYQNLWDANKAVHKRKFITWILETRKSM